MSSRYAYLVICSLVLGIGSLAVLASKPKPYLIADLNPHTAGNLEKKTNGEACSYCRSSDDITQDKTVSSSCCKEGGDSCCSMNKNVSSKNLAVSDDCRKIAEEFMLMMQGMAGIGPSDSAWVFDKLFEGFIPAPMPCCGPPGSKDKKDEHKCCQVQVDAIKASEDGSASSAAFVRFQEQFSHVHRSELLDRYLKMGIGPSSLSEIPNIRQAASRSSNS